MLASSSEVSTKARGEMVDLECDGKRRATVARSMQFARWVMTLALHTTCLLKHFATRAMIIILCEQHKGILFPEESEESPMESDVWAQKI